MSKQAVWPKIVEKPLDYILCDCDQPRRVTIVRQNTSEVVFRCGNCGREEVYKVSAGDPIGRGGWVGCRQGSGAEEASPEVKKPRNRHHGRLPPFTPDYDRTAVQDGEDKRDWFRRVMK